MHSTRGAALKLAPPRRDEDMMNSTTEGTKTAWDYVQDGTPITEAQARDLLRSYHGADDRAGFVYNLADWMPDAEASAPLVDLLCRDRSTKVLLALLEHLGRRLTPTQLHTIATGRWFESRTLSSNTQVYLRLDLTEPWNLERLTDETLTHLETRPLDATVIARLRAERGRRTGEVQSAPKPEEYFLRVDRVRERQYGSIPEAAEAYIRAVAKDNLDIDRFEQLGNESARCIEEQVVDIMDAFTAALKDVATDPRADIWTVVDGILESDEFSLWNDDCTFDDFQLEASRVVRN